jgi:hypothetical protein
VLAEAFRTVISEWMMIADRAIVYTDQDGRAGCNGRGFRTGAVTQSVDVASIDWVVGGGWSVAGGRWPVMACPALDGRFGQWCL